VARKNTYVDHPKITHATSNNATPPTHLTAYPDTAATGHFVPPHCPGRALPHEPIIAWCANNTTMTSVATMELQIPTLPPALKKATVFEEMKKPLVSIPVLCDGDCEVTFSKLKVVITDKQKNVLLEGPRDMQSRLWLIPIVQRKISHMERLMAQRTRDNTRPKWPDVDTNINHCVHSAYHQKTIPKLMSYLHACVGSLPPVTWMKAISNDWFSSWPGLTTAAVRKHLPKSNMTTMGHMHRIRKGIRPSAKVSTDDMMQEAMEAEPPLEPPRGNIDRGHFVGIDAVKFETLKGIISTDLPGRFPITSAQGNAYIFVLYDFDSNSILATPIKNRTKKSLIAGYKECLRQLTKAGIKPILHRLDNEISKDMIAEIELRQMDYQIASPGDHRLNFAERAIQTFKNHFIAVLHGCDPQFPANQWDRLIPQAVMTLNMVRPSRINPKLSAYNQLWGIFNFEKTPLAPPGCQVIIHNRPQERGTWADHGVVGFYIGPAMHHFRNYVCYIPTTRGERISNTIEFFPAHVEMPETSSEDRLAQVTQDLIEVLKKPHPKTPFLEQGDRTSDAIQKLTTIFRPPQRNDNTNNGGKPNYIVRFSCSQAPRVLRPDLARQRPPRVLAIENLTTINHTPIGTQVKKKFGRHMYNGTVTSYDASTNFYYIQYADGDNEEMTEAEVNKYKHTTRMHHANQVAGKGIQRIPLPPHYINAVYDDETGKMLEYRHLLNHKNPRTKQIWDRAGANEFGRLMQGIGKERKPEERIKGMNSMKFISKHKVPKHKTITYARFVSDIRPQKDEQERVRLTAGGNRLPYEGKTSTETAGLETTKILLNSTISTKDGKFACFDIGNMYLNTTLPSPEYMRIHVSMIPQEVIAEYDVTQYLDENGYAYVEITGAIYGLAQSGYLANEDLKKNLAPFGYYPSNRTHGLWHHKTRNIKFSLVVDDFGVRYVKKEDAQHLLDSIATKYPVKADWTGSKYIGIDLDWDYKKREVRLSMKGYVKKALKEFQHPMPEKPVYGPTPYTAPIYGKSVQYAPTIPVPTFTDKQIRHIQQVCGKFLYPARTVDNTMLHALNELCIAATKGTEETAKALIHFLNYCATNPDAEIIYRASDMILSVDSDAAYLIAPQARSRASGYHYLGNKDGKLFNGAIFILTKLIPTVMSSAADAECGGLYMNAREAVPMITTLEELGHPQPDNGTPIRTDNSTADGIMNKTVKQKRSKSMDMRFWWLIDRVEQNQFRIFWAPGRINLADYFSKKHPASHHKKVRPIYINIKGASPSLIQGCDKILTN
jgi:hypothetical protein